VKRASAPRQKRAKTHRRPRAPPPPLALSLLSVAQMLLPALMVAVAASHNLLCLRPVAAQIWWTVPTPISRSMPPPPLYYGLRRRDGLSLRGWHARALLLGPLMAHFRAAHAFNLGSAGHQVGVSSSRAFPQRREDMVVTTLLDEIPSGFRRYVLPVT
jgi:hypothetical protein